MKKEWEITPEIAALIGKMNNEYEQRKLDRLEQAKLWGRELDGKFIGVCGHLTGAGAIEYPVFRQEDGKCFISYGPKKDLYFFDGDTDQYINSQEEVKEKCKTEGKERVLVLSSKVNFEERNEQIIMFINPNSIFGRTMETIEEWLK